MAKLTRFATIFIVFRRITSGPHEKPRRKQTYLQPWLHHGVAEIERPQTRADARMSASRLLAPRTLWSIVIMHSLDNRYCHAFESRLAYPNRPLHSSLNARSLGLFDSAIAWRRRFCHASGKTSRLLVL